MLKGQLIYFHLAFNQTLPYNLAMDKPTNNLKSETKTSKSHKLKLLNLGNSQQIGNQKPVPYIC